LSRKSPTPGRNLRSVPRLPEDGAPDRSTDPGADDRERPAAPSALDVLGRVPEAVARHGRAVLAQIVRAEGSTPGKPGWKMLVLPDGGCYGNLGGGAFEAMVQADARARLASLVGAREPNPKRYYLTEEATRGQATGMVCGGMTEVFFEELAAPPLLAIYGGGPVGQAVARAGDLAGFDLLVADDRPEFRCSELFPEGCHLPEVDRRFSADLLAPFPGRDVYAAVVSRCWETDTAALTALLSDPPARLVYVGLMGSRRKVERVRGELSSAGIDLSAFPFHAPIGLSLGGDSPGEIAISVLAQVQKVRHEVDPS
jgi:xanthine dehydrogenase accessory factor